MDGVFVCVPALTQLMSVQLLFHLVGRLNEHASVTVTMNLAFIEWRTCSAARQ